MEGPDQGGAVLLPRTPRTAPLQPSCPAAQNQGAPTPAPRGLQPAPLAKSAIPWRRLVAAHMAPPTAGWSSAAGPHRSSPASPGTSGNRGGCPAAGTSPKSWHAPQTPGRPRGEYPAWGHRGGFCGGYSGGPQPRAERLLLHEPGAPRSCQGGSLRAPARHGHPTARITSPADRTTRPPLGLQLPLPVSLVLLTDPQSTEREKTVLELKQTQPGLIRPDQRTVSSQDVDL